MTPETLAALDASIAKWDRIAESGDESSPLGSEECPLCQLFFLKEDTCADCPVARATGQGGCNGTPYEDAYDEWIFLSDGYDLAAFRVAAREEALFLRAIRPIGEPTPPAQGGSDA